MTTKMSGTLEKAGLRAKSLYRAAMRSVPSVVAGYELECTPGHLRAVIRALFRQQMHVTEPGMIDVLCYKGELELEETLQMWKTKAHVQKYVDWEDVSKPDFVRDFFASNTVDEWTWPPSSSEGAQAKQ